MLEIRISRFDKALDKYSYFKPYFYENVSEFATLNDLLSDVKANDPYFDFEIDSYVKINQIIIKLDEKLSDVIEKLGSELYILPLDEFRATKDLIIDKSAFEDKFKLFPCTKPIHKEFYNKLLAPYYSSEVTFIKEDFIGNSGFIFAKYLLQQAPDCQNKIIKLIKPQLPFYMKPNVFRQEYNINQDIEVLDKICNYKREDKKAEVEVEPILNQEFKQDFSNFNIAVYNDKMAEKFVQKVGGKICEFMYEDMDYCFDGLKYDEKTVLELASKIIFEAYDSGADFLLVNSEQDFEMFDTMSKDLMWHKNRDLEGFYIIKMSEFIDLANSIKPSSLKLHKLKVGLL